MSEKSLRKTKKTKNPRLNRGVNKEIDKKDKFEMFKKMWETFNFRRQSIPLINPQFNASTGQQLAEDTYSRVEPNLYHVNDVILETNDLPLDESKDSIAQYDENPETNCKEYSSEFIRLKEENQILRLRLKEALEEIERLKKKRAEKRRGKTNKTVLYGTKFSINSLSNKISRRMFKKRFTSPKIITFNRRAQKLRQSKLKDNHKNFKSKVWSSSYFEKKRKAFQKKSKKMQKKLKQTQDLFSKKKRSEASKYMLKTRLRLKRNVFNQNSYLKIMKSLKTFTPIKGRIPIADIRKKSTQFYQTSRNS